MTIIHLALTVSGASAKNAYCIYGHPTPFAAIGFAHALTQRAGLRQTSGVLFAVHDYADRATAMPYRGAVYHLQRSAERDAVGESQLDLPRCDFEASIVFEAEPPGDEPLQEALEGTLETMRFAGGRIDRAICRTGAPSLAKALTRPGFVLTDPGIASTGDPFDTLIEHVTPKEGRPGWFVPSLVGFRLLEEPRPRDGARGGHPHAYCDPLLWILEWKWGRAIEDLDRHLWQTSRQGSLIRFHTHGVEHHAATH